MTGAAELDALTVDAFGTLVELHSPAERLQEALATRGVEAELDAVAAAFASEVEYYVRHKVEGHDGPSLERLRQDCTAVFLSALGSDLEPETFAPDFAAALVFRPVAGVIEALRALSGAGLALACVSNWDVSVGEQLERSGVGAFLSTVVSSAEVGKEKPAPQVFELALERLGVEAGRALHVGDADTDVEGARAAGLRFELPPLSTLPARLGL